MIQNFINYLYDIFISKTNNNQQNTPKMSNNKIIIPELGKVNFTGRDIWDPKSVAKCKK